MDKRSFVEVNERLMEVNRIIEKLDPTIRPSAFELLKPYVQLGISSRSAEGSTPEVSSPAGGGSNLSLLLEKHSDKKPSDNAFLLTANWYHQYGLVPFSLANIRQGATSAGLTIPERLDKTLQNAQDGGKKLYQTVSQGMYKPTVHGEIYLKRVYGVTKGTGTPPEAAKS